MYVFGHDFSSVAQTPDYIFVFRPGHCFCKPDIFHNPHFCKQKTSKTSKKDLFMSTSKVRLTIVLLCAGGCAAHPALPLPGEVPVESSPCPYCSYYNRVRDPQIQAADGDHRHQQQRGPVGSPPPPLQPPCKSPTPRPGEGHAARHVWRACARCWAELRGKLELIVGSRYFNRGIMIAILINTLSMGIEYHEQVWACMWGRRLGRFPPHIFGEQQCSRSHVRWQKRLKKMWTSEAVIFWG